MVCNVEDAIDENLKIMGFIFTLMDALPTIKDVENTGKQANTSALIGVGIAGPSVIGGAMLLLYKIALVLFVGFAPIFILSLLFEQTKDLFKRWLLYGIGTMFSMAVLSFMVSVATKVVAISAAAMIASYYAAANPGSVVGGVMGAFGFGQGISSAALQQGGVGLLMSVLMVMSPPMAAMFFNGSLGSFAANSSFNNLGRNSSGWQSDVKPDFLLRKSVFVQQQASVWVQVPGPVDCSSGRPLAPVGRCDRGVECRPPIVKFSGRMAPCSLQWRDQLPGSSRGRCK